MFDLLKHLSNESLEALASEVYHERERRIDVASMPEPNLSERDYWFNGHKVDAIKAYRERTNTISLMACKRKLESLDIPCSECRHVGNTHKLDCSKR